MIGAAPVASPGARVAENILVFARLLRTAGLRTGLSAAHDAVAAASLTGLERREDFYWALRTSLVKRREDSALFDQAFELLWRQPTEAPPGEGGETTAKIDNALSRRLQDALAAAPRTARAREIETTAASLRYAASESFQRKDFAQMSAAEIAQAMRAVQTLASPENLRPTRRLRASHRGRRIDWRRALRGSLRTGGAPVRLPRRERRREPSPLVLLVDISGSMEAYARVLLAFAHALTNGRAGVSVFLFGTRLANVTRLLRHRDADEALARVGSAITDWSGGTRIGESLGRFNRLWMRRALARGGIVLLMTDGLDRGDAAALSHEAARLQRNCDRLVWLNPLLRYESFEPRAAGVRAILPFVDAFRPVHNLTSLAQLVNALQAGE
jgi:uncharacterized protein with von Willebrand factor type A (vWA) domain